MGYRLHLDMDSFQGCHFVNFLTGSFFTCYLLFFSFGYLCVHTLLLVESTTGRFVRNNSSLERDECRLF